MSSRLPESRQPQVMRTCAYRATGPAQYLAYLTQAMPLPLASWTARQAIQAIRARVIIG